MLTQLICLYRIIKDVFFKIEIINRWLKFVYCIIVYLMLYNVCLRLYIVCLRFKVHIVCLRLYVKCIFDDV